MPRGVVPPGTYANGGRSPVVYVLLCPPCAGYAPTTDEDYEGALSGRCQGCGANTRELHRFQAVILSAANGGCMCVTGHPQVTGDLPTEDEARAVLLEVQTRPPQRHPEAAAEEPRQSRIVTAEPSADEPWWCDCPDRKGPHVHFPNWGNEGSSIALTALVDTETGMEIPGSRKGGSG
jgi:hypothetical protein